MHEDLVNFPWIRYFTLSSFFFVNIVILFKTHILFILPCHPRVFGPTENLFIFIWMSRANLEKAKKRDVRSSTKENTVRTIGSSSSLSTLSLSTRTLWWLGFFKFMENQRFFRVGTKFAELTSEKVYTVYKEKKSLDTSNTCSCEIRVEIKICSFVPKFFKPGK